MPAFHVEAEDVDPAPDLGVEILMEEAEEADGEEANEDTFGEVENGDPTQVTSFLVGIERGGFHEGSGPFLKGGNFRLAPQS
jgi:hypothetical protein